MAEDFGPDVDAEGVPYCCYACPHSDDWSNWCRLLEADHMKLRRESRMCPPPECPARKKELAN